jgi:hypothetical protein
MKFTNLINLCLNFPYLLLESKYFIFWWRCYCFSKKMSKYNDDARLLRSAFCNSFHATQVPLHQNMLFMINIDVSKIQEESCLIDWKNCITLKKLWLHVHIAVLVSFVDYHTVIYIDHGFDVRILILTCDNSRISHMYQVMMKTWTFSSNWSAANRDDCSYVLRARCTRIVRIVLANKIPYMNIISFFILFTPQRCMICYERESAKWFLVLENTWSFLSPCLSLWHWCTSHFDDQWLISLLFWMLKQSIRVIWLANLLHTSRSSKYDLKYSPIIWFNGQFRKFISGIQDWILLDDKTNQLTSMLFYNQTCHDKFKNWICSSVTFVMNERFYSILSHNAGQAVGYTFHCPLSPFHFAALVVV